MSIFIIMAGLAFVSCTTHPLKYDGDIAAIDLTDGRRITGELLMLTDSSLWVLSAVKAGSEPDSGNRICSTIAIPLIQTIVVKGYVNHNWWGLVGSNILGGLLLTAASSSVGEGRGAIFLISPLIQMLLFIVSEPKNPTIEFPLDGEKRRELLQYVRLPQELDSSQVQSLLHQLGDPEVRSASR